MELTKAERKILSPNYDKKLKRSLWLGILCFCISAGVIAFTIIRTADFKTYWDRNQIEIAQKIVPSTKLEVQLKKMLLENLTESRNMYIKYATGKFQHAIIYSFLVGCVLVGGYFRARTYMKLIRKLKQTPNNRVKTAAE